jgi:two-component system, cell cycle sensor histidine kinase and response regulator CckA
VDEQTTERTANMASPATSRQARLLVVDDEPVVRRMAREVLTRAGFNVREAGSGEEAVAIVQAGILLDGVLLDVTMPGLGGPEAFRQIRRLRPGVPVVITSGYAGHDLPALFGGDGISGFVQKPFTSATLVRALRAAVGDARAASVA